jgi:integrase
VVPATVLQTLQEHRKRQVEERLLAGSNWQGDAMNLVFTTIHGRPLDGVTVTRQFQRLLQRSGLPRLRYHDLRHSCATLLLVQGVAPRVVMETLGHSDISLTMNTYSHVLPELQREAAQRMDDFLSGTSG